jgi:hypothetical protein
MVFSVLDEAGEQQARPFFIYFWFFWFVLFFVFEKNKIIMANKMKGTYKVLGLCCAARQTRETDVGAQAGEGGVLHANTQKKKGSSRQKKVARRQPATPK